MPVAVPTTGKACLSFLTREASPRLRRKKKAGTKIAWEEADKSKGTRDDAEEDAPGWIDIGIGAAISLVATVADAIGGDEGSEGVATGTATRAHLGSSGGDLRYDEVKGRWVLPGSDDGKEKNEDLKMKAPPPVGLSAGGGDGSGSFRQRAGSKRYVAL